MLDLDFNGDAWRDEMLFEQRVKFLAAPTQQEQRAHADLMVMLQKGRDAAKARREHGPA